MSPHPTRSQPDPGLWSLHPLSAATQPSDETLAKLINLAHAEFRAGHYSAVAAIARLIRQRAPDEPEPQRLLSLVAAWLPSDQPPPNTNAAEYYLSLGEAYHLLGDSEKARTNYQAALHEKPNLVEAHIALAAIRMPGDF